MKPKRDSVLAKPLQVNAPLKSVLLGTNPKGNSPLSYVFLVRNLNGTALRTLSPVKVAIG